MKALALTLVLLAAQDKKTPDKPLQGIAAKCGTEIPWLTSMTDATVKARATKRPIAWWVPTLEGTPMDRKLVLERYMLAGPFMMPGVVELLRDRFVPLRLAGDPGFHKAYGVELLEFIEPGLVFLDGDGKLIHKVDRISTFNEEWFVQLLRGVLKKSGAEAGEKPVELDAARQAIRDGKPDPSLFDKQEGPEARYFHGVALHLVGRDGEGRAEWRKVKEGRWSWKAAAELARDGPFVRGFETYERPPAESLEGLPTSTTLPAKKVDVARAVRFLLQTQRANGAWDDSNYNFGGDDSLPNVHMAGTALAAMALREWGAADEVKAALAKAEAYLKDETKVAAKDTDEIAWAYAYRILYFAKTEDKKTLATLVRMLCVLQKGTGTWYHEYDNPFVTATALHALHEAKKAGADVPDATLKRGAAALKSTRDRQGMFAYEYPGRGGAPEGAAGRAPFCEFALHLSGLSKKEAVAGSLAESFKHHARLEKVRKYDDHADAHHNGGFFFWYDQLGRALAASAIGDAASLARQKEIVLAIPEIDGCWVDSHELGRSYGTAMALLTLKVCGN
ncbi:MAG TPA: hypothetical protein VJB14_06785 [Planctomycetota bacterium]|nr:hypothetical protein [Planctomycetota bacterium]